MKAQVHSELANCEKPAKQSGLAPKKSEGKGCRTELIKRWESGCHFAVHYVSYTTRIWVMAGGSEH